MIYMYGYKRSGDIETNLKILNDYLNDPQATTTRDKYDVTTKMSMEEKISVKMDKWMIPIFDIKTSGRDKNDIFYTDPVIDSNGLQLITDCQTSSIKFNLEMIGDIEMTYASPEVPSTPKQQSIKRKKGSPTGISPPKKGTISKKGSTDSSTKNKPRKTIDPSGKSQAVLKKEKMDAEKKYESAIDDYIGQLSKESKNAYMSRIISWHDQYTRGDKDESIVVIDDENTDLINETITFYDTTLFTLDVIIIIINRRLKVLTDKIEGTEKSSKKLKQEIGQTVMEQQLKKYQQRDTSDLVSQNFMDSDLLESTSFELGLTDIPPPSLLIPKNKDKENKKTAMSLIKEQIAEDRKRIGEYSDKIREYSREHIKWEKILGSIDEYIESYNTVEASKKIINDLDDMLKTYTKRTELIFILKKIKDEDHTILEKIYLYELFDILKNYIAEDIISTKKNIDELDAQGIDDISRYPFLKTFHSTEKKYDINKLYDDIENLKVKKMEEEYLENIKAEKEKDQYSYHKISSSDIRKIMDFFTAENMEYLIQFYMDFVKDTGENIIDIIQNEDSDPIGMIIHCLRECNLLMDDYNPSKIFVENKYMIEESVSTIVEFDTIQNDIKNKIDLYNKVKMESINTSNLIEDIINLRKIKTKSFAKFVISTEYNKNVLRLRAYIFYMKNSIYNMISSDVNDGASYFSADDITSIRRITERCVNDRYIYKDLQNTYKPIAGVRASEYVKNKYDYMVAYNEQLLDILFKLIKLMPIASKLRPGALDKKLGDIVKQFISENDIKDVAYVPDEETLKKLGAIRKIKQEVIDDEINQQQNKNIAEQEISLTSRELEAIKAKKRLSKLTPEEYSRYKRMGRFASEEKEYDPKLYSDKSEKTSKTKKDKEEYEEEEEEISDDEDEESSSSSSDEDKEVERELYQELDE